MLKSFFNWFKAGAAKPTITDPEKVKRMYTWRRWSVFISLIGGYGMYYVCRMSIAVVKKPMLDEGVFTASQLGAIGAGLLMVYAFAKMFNGFIADRCNIKKFMPFGLLVSALINLALGFTTAFWLFAFLWAVNGWFQSMGSAPCVVSLSQWFSNRERATRYGVWSVSHYVGEGLTFIGTACIVVYFGWRSAFVWPGVVCALGALLTYKFMYDRPETCGLPPIAEYNDDHAAAKGKTQSTWEAQKEVLKNPFVWMIGLSAACMSIARYSVNSWGIIFLQEHKGYDLIVAGSILAVTPIMGAIGSAASGFISDKVFRSRHALTTLVFGCVMLGGLVAFCFNPPGNKILDTIYISIFGFGLGVLLCFVGGLLAVDISSSKAAGAAMGTVGLLSYLGATSQDLINGLMMDASKVMVNGKAVYNFDNIILFWVGSVAAMILLILPSLWAKKSE